MPDAELRQIRVGWRICSALLDGESGWRISRVSAKRSMEHRAPPWQPGQSGNPKGRALGSRNRMSESFLEDLRATWEKHGAHAGLNDRSNTGQIE
ncbi:DUF5681 domain-containing protein [Bradyrhizobium sp. PMVTL-01]|uniref:DUF5681 domain-containing protein n=1 Tax=Bradyrhizobium sp. PMVTL-01 TaxID=3434999 RepID=UPI003F705FB0